MIRSIIISTPTIGTIYYYHKYKKTDRKSTRLNSSHSQISYAVFCLKKKNQSQGARSVAYYRRSSGRGVLLARPSIAMWATPFLSRVMVSTTHTSLDLPVLLSNTYH